MFSSKSGTHECFGIKLKSGVSCTLRLFLKTDFYSSKEGTEIDSLASSQTVGDEVKRVASFRLSHKLHSAQFVSTNATAIKVSYV